MNEIINMFLIFGLTFLLIIISSNIIGIFYSISPENIALINIHSTIEVNEGVLDSTISSDSIISYLKEAENNPNVEAIVLSINSPGGTVVASKEVSEYIKNVKKPIIAWIREIGTSGAYLIASSCDYIIADNLSIVGSIGAKISYLEYSETLKKYGVKYVSITSGDMKDTFSQYKNISNQEKEILEYQINQSFNYFLNKVIINRNLTREQIEQIRDGRIFSGEQAKELNLIDECGGIKKVNEYLLYLNITNITYKEYNNDNVLNEILNNNDLKLNPIYPKYD